MTCLVEGGPRSIQTSRGGSGQVTALQPIQAVGLPALIIPQVQTGRTVQCGTASIATMLPVLLSWMTLVSAA